jgi:hypothetical protein
MTPWGLLWKTIAIGTAFLGCRDADRSKVQQVSPGELRAGPIRHDTLTPAQVDRITRLHETFRDVDPTPLSKWLEDFKRDNDPDREIRIYEGMAEAYQAFCTGRDLSHAAKSEAYQVVLLRCGASDEEVLRSTKPQVLTVGEVKEILARYRMPPAPITVTPTPGTP